MRLPLAQLAATWESCRACELGRYREDTGGAFVFGEGAPHGIMFIGEGPGVTEEEEGRPFVGASGEFLRERLRKLGLRDYYLTNTVCCRSWEFLYDTEGNPQMDRRTNLQRRRDSPPIPAQREQCKWRLYQQIYIVDPILIVPLGGAATETLMGKSVTMGRVNGELLHVKIPGAGALANKTPKGTYARKVGPKENRVLVVPSDQNYVKYDVIPVVHPAYAMRGAEDLRPGSPMEQFIKGLKKVRDVYSMYGQEVNGDAQIMGEEE